VLVQLGSPVTVTIVRRTRAGVDRNGNDTWTETLVHVDGCAWWPGSAGRNVAGTRDYGEETFRNQTTTRAQVMFPSGTVVSSDDHVILPALPSARWAVDGDGLQWESHFTGATTGVQVSVARTDG